MYVDLIVHLRCWSDKLYKSGDKLVDTGGDKDDDNMVIIIFHIID